MAEEKVYERIEAAEAVIKTLCEKYPDVLWRVKPDRIAVLGIANKERSEKCKDFVKVNPIKGSNKALNLMYKVPISIIFEFYWSDWNIWNATYKEWILMKALLMVSEEDGKMVKPDCKDFRIILDILGVDWEKRDDLPSLTNTVVEFNKDLRPGMEDYDENDGDGESKDVELKEEN